MKKLFVGLGLIIVIVSFVFSQSIESAIRDYAKKEYPDDADMQDYVYRQQMSAYRYMLAATDEEVERIAVREYPEDYSMQQYIYKRQISAKQNTQPATNSAAKPTAERDDPVDDPIKDYSETPWGAAVKEGNTAYDQDDYTTALASYTKAMRMGCLDGIVFYRFAYSLNSLDLGIDSKVYFDRSRNSTQRASAADTFALAYLLIKVGHPQHRYIESAKRQLESGDSTVWGDAFPIYQTSVDHVIDEAGPDPDIGDVLARVYADLLEDHWSSDQLPYLFFVLDDIATSNFAQEFLITALENEQESIVKNLLEINGQELLTGEGGEKIISITLDNGQLDLVDSLLRYRYGVASLLEEDRLSMEIVGRLLSKGKLSMAKSLLNRGFPYPETIPSSIELGVFMMFREALVYYVGTLKRGEFESTEQFENRKIKISSILDGVEIVQTTRNVALQLGQYDADNEWFAFMIEFPEDELGIATPASMFGFIQVPISEASGYKEGNEITKLRAVAEYGYTEGELSYKLESILVIDSTTGEEAPNVGSMPTLVATSKFDARSVTISWVCRIGNPVSYRLSRLARGQEQAPVEIELAATEYVDVRDLENNQYYTYTVTPKTQAGKWGKTSNGDVVQVAWGVGR